MHHLDLSPLPCAFPQENPRSSAGAAPGFVDDAVVMALLTGPIGTRLQSEIGTLALAVDEMDYAGWPPSAPPHARIARRS